MPRHAIARGALLVGCGVVLIVTATLAVADHRADRTTARLEDAAEQLDSLTEMSPADDAGQAAIAWGYAERLRLGLESPFRLIEAAADDPRLGEAERRMVSWALLAHVIRGESHQVDPAVLDLVGAPMAGEQHLDLIADAVNHADNPRAGELAVRFAYTLAAAERIVDPGAPALVAEVAALLADREIARREGVAIARAVRAVDPIEEIRRRRARRALYVERPALLLPDPDIEADAVRLVPALLHAIRDVPGAAAAAPTATGDTATEEQARLVAELQRTARQRAPSGPLAVTVRRYLPLVAPHVHPAAAETIRQAINPELLVAARPMSASRIQRRAVGRLFVAAAVAMRSMAQEPGRAPHDSLRDPVRMAAATGLASIVFDRDVPASWRPDLLNGLWTGVQDLRRVLPAFQLSEVNVRFRMTAPADSALAMHDPRSRTLHLPAVTAGGTLLHELAHDLDRQSAVRAGLPGYRSDAEVRGDSRRHSRTAAGGERVAASLRALTEDIADLPRATRAAAERPAEIFATRVDWFVAQALARDGISSGFLSGVQDEILTGHVVHPQRLRSSGRSRSLLDALEGMTPVSPRAREAQLPTAHTLLRWALTGPVDRDVAANILADERTPWQPTLFGPGGSSCQPDNHPRAELVRLAAESRARGWVRQRARWQSEANRAPWAQAALGRAPWRSEATEGRTSALADHVLLQLSSSTDLPAGLGAYAPAIAGSARCAD